MGQSELEILEENYVAAQNEIRDLKLSALQAMKALNDRTGSCDLDIERYRALKAKLENRLPLLETKVRRARIERLQEQRNELQKELAEIEPAQRETKRLVIEAQKLLDEAWQKHARLDLKAAGIESQLAINFESTRSNQRSLQDLIGELTGINEDVDHDDGLSANTENLLIRN